MAKTVTIDDRRFKAAAKMAREAGKTPARYIESLIDAATMTFDEILAPVGEDFRKSGVTEEELDAVVTQGRQGNLPTIAPDGPQMRPIAGRPRVVFDCNVLVQAASNTQGPAGRALSLLEKSAIEVYVSKAAMKELRAVLNYPHVRAKLPTLSDERIDAFLDRLAFRATLPRDVPHIFDYPRAKQDEPYVDLAAAAGAQYLVSRDNDLLSLATDHSWSGKRFRQQIPNIRILNPVAFLQAVASTTT